MEEYCRRVALTIVLHSHPCPFEVAEDQLLAGAGHPGLHRIDGTISRGSGAGAQGLHGAARRGSAAEGRPQL